jgi:hypothetical protein
MSASTQDSAETPFRDNPAVLVAYTEVMALMAPFLVVESDRVAVVDGYAAPVAAFIDRCESVSPDHALVALAGLGMFAQAFSQAMGDPDLQPGIDPASGGRFIDHCRSYLPRITALGQLQTAGMMAADPKVFAKFRAESEGDLEAFRAGQEAKAKRVGMPTHLALRLQRVAEVRNLDEKKKK